MANTKDKPEVLEEVALHNKRVFEVEREYERFEFLGSERVRLRNALIKPRSEMEGEGLRRTYVSMGRAWLEDSHIERWRRANEYLIRQRRMVFAQKATLLTLAVVVCVLNVVVYYRTFRDDVLPAFGETMKRIRPEMPLFDELTRFAKITLSKVGGNGTDAASNRPSTDMEALPPELRTEWKARLNKVRRSADNLEIERILEDPERRGVYYVICDANLRGMGKVNFRIQCARRSTGKLVFLALE